MRKGRALRQGRETLSRALQPLKRASVCQWQTSCEPTETAVENDETFHVALSLLSLLPHSFGYPP